MIGLAAVKVLYRTVASEFPVHLGKEAMIFGFNLPEKRNRKRKTKPKT